MKKERYDLSDFGVMRQEGLLSNGLRVVFIQKPFAPIHTKIMMRAGSICDPLGKEGLAHFTEHIIASGSKQLSKEAFSGLLESVGGYWNATTGEDFMSVECEVALPEHLDRVQQYFHHALSDIHITEESLEKEKEIIISEMESAHSNPKYHAYWYIARKIAGDTVWGRPTIGTQETVSQFSVQDVQNFFKTYCVLENMVLIVAGGCTWEDIEHTFSQLVLPRGEIYNLPKDPEFLSSTELILYEQDVPQTTIAFMFKAPSVNTRAYSLLNFAIRFAHDGITSRFYKKIRNERGLAYGLGSFKISFNEHTNYIGTQLGVPTNKVQQTIDAIRECYKELIEEGINQKEIDDKIDTLWFSAHRNLERVSDWVDTIDYDELYPAEKPLYGAYPDIYNYRRTYTANEIKDVLKTYITLDSPYLAISGRGVKKIKNLLKKPLLE